MKEPIKTLAEFYDYMSKSNNPNEVIPVTIDLLKKINQGYICNICKKYASKGHRHFHNGYLVIGSAAISIPFIFSEEHKLIIIPWYSDFEMDEIKGEHFL